MNKLRVGIVGAGIMGELHSNVYRTIPGVSLEAVCDGNLERAKALANKVNVTRIFPTHQEMLGNSDLDIVSVCTPDFAHAEPTIDAANAGKHVLVEKPLAVTVADAEAILEAAVRNKVKVMTQFSHRWVPAYRQTKNFLSAGKLGEPVMAYARKNDPISVPTEMIGWAERSTPSWFLSSHDIDLVCWYFESEPVEVYALSVSKVLVKKGIQTNDAAQALVKFANGAIATFEACWSYPNTWPTMPDSFIEVVTTSSVIHLDRKIEQIELSSEEAFQYPRNLLVTVYEDNELQGAVPLAIRHFVKCIQQDTDPLVTLESSLRVTRILDAIQRSIDTCAPIKLPFSREAN